MPASGTERVREQRRVSAFVLLAGWVLFIGFMVAVSVVTSAEDKLLAEGARASGTVVGYHPASRGGGSMDVRFEVNGVGRTSTVHLNDSSPEYHEGQQVQVVYDPADPGRLRTDEEENEPPWLVWPMVIALVGGVILIPVGWIEHRRWSKRYRDVRANGWTHGRATISMHGRRRILNVTLDNGDTLRLRENVQRFTDLKIAGTTGVWVGGRGSTLLFRDRPYLTAARPWSRD